MSCCYFLVHVKPYNSINATTIIERSYYIKPPPWQHSVTFGNRMIRCKSLCPRSHWSSPQKGWLLGVIVAIAKIKIFSTHLTIIMKYCSAAHCNSIMWKVQPGRSSHFCKSLLTKCHTNSQWLWWKSFVSTRRKDFQPSNAFYICSQHYTETDLENVWEYDFRVDTLKLDPG
mgnify:CR=1 FL=1